MNGESEQREEFSSSEEDDSDDEFYEEDYDWTDETGGDTFSIQTKTNTKSCSDIFSSMGIVEPLAFMQ